MLNCAGYLGCVKIRRRKKSSIWRWLRRRIHGSFNQVSHPTFFQFRMKRLSSGNFIQIFRSFSDHDRCWRFSFHYKARRRTQILLKCLLKSWVNDLNIFNNVLLTQFGIFSPYPGLVEERAGIGLDWRAYSRIEYRWGQGAGQSPPSTVSSRKINHLYIILTYTYTFNTDQLNF